VPILKAFLASNLGKKSRTRRRAFTVALALGMTQVLVRLAIVATSD
jgi:hypothetical protein